MSNAVLQWQIITRDPKSAAGFYTKLFDWTIDAGNAMGYREVKTGSTGIDGGIWPAPPDGRDFVQLFVSVPDLQKSVDEAIALGASLLVPVTELPDGDAMAVMLDPVGISFGLMRAR